MNITCSSELIPVQGLVVVKAFMYIDLTHLQEKLLKYLLFPFKTHHTSAFHPMKSMYMRYRKWTQRFPVAERFHLLPSIKPMVSLRLSIHSQAVAIIPAMFR